MKPRILFVDHVGVLGGGELSLLDIVRAYRETSRVVLFQDGPFRERLEQAGVDVVLLRAQAAVSQVVREGGWMHDLQAVPEVLRLVWRLARLGRAYDVLYANSQKAMIVTALAGLVARRPVIWHLRDMMSADHFSGWHRRLAVGCANLMVRRVIANSQATRQAFVASGGRPEKVHVVYNGLDASVFEKVGDEEVQQLRASLGLADVPVVGVFSRLAAWKGQHVLIEALAALPEVHALLVGHALFDADRAYAADLRAQAARLGVADRVHFLGFRRDVPSLLKVTDVVLHTSVAPEPFGRVIAEGMLAERPVIATRAGGALEIIEPGRTGLLVPPGDPEVLAGAIRNVLERADRRQALARNGRAEAQQRFSVEAMREGLRQHIEAAAG